MMFSFKDGETKISDNGTTALRAVQFYGASGFQGFGFK
jgi:hypothetical protein